jgi:hypothetical protein
MHGSKGCDISTGMSAQLSVLEARSKSWGRIGQAPKGRSQSAPRGVPRSRIIASSGNAAERAIPALVCTSGQALASSEASGAKVWACAYLTQTHT